MKQLTYIIISLTVVLSITGCGKSERNASASEGHTHEASPHDHVTKGPHGGKLFERDGFALEVTIFEPDIPPQSRVYAYYDDKPLDPSEVTLTTELHRIDRVDTIQYRKQDDYLQGDIVVEEPHSFDVKLHAVYLKQNKKYSFEYSSYEGRTILSDDALQSSGISIEKVKGATIATYVTLTGRIVPHKLRVSALTARFSGVVKEIKKLPGSRVEKGDVIATIEANESLKVYDLIAPRSGEILDLAASVGELVTGNDTLVTVGDLSSVWIELSIPKSDFTKLKVGQKVLVTADGQKEPIEGKLTYLSSVADGDTQTRLARAEVPNRDHLLVPELFVNTNVVISERQVPVAIKAEALQKFRDWDVVFKRKGQVFEIAILELGEQDGDLIEVRAGLEPGTEYVTTNSFVVKADVMKSGATHDH
jgi:cobalt-zinc-cadmium efflux system membrane fusion protein